jgi:hypothetical protein
MNPVFHILNGDALSDQFPKILRGDRIVMRECLVEGPVKDIDPDPDSFYTDRISFLNHFYGPVTADDYQRQTISQFDKMKNLPVDAPVNLWFEDDLFCQVNFWFVVQLLHKQKQVGPVFLIRPLEKNNYGFGGFNSEELCELYDERIPLTDLDLLAKLWPAFQDNNRKKLKDLATRLQKTYPFILPAVQAHLDREPIDGSLGRPEQTLLSIIKDFGTTKFEKIFPEFCRREAIYGFGDL